LCLPGLDIPLFYHTSGVGCVYLDTGLPYIWTRLCLSGYRFTIHLEKVVFTWIQVYHTSGEGCVYLDTVLQYIWSRLCLPGYSSTIHLEKVVFTWIQFYHKSGEGCVYLDTVLSYIGEGCVYLDKISICSQYKWRRLCAYLDTVLPYIWRRLCLPRYSSTIHLEKIVFTWIRYPSVLHKSGEGCVYLDKISLCSTIHLEKVLFTWIRYPSVLPYIWRRLCLAVTIW